MDSEYIRFGRFQQLLSEIVVKFINTLPKELKQIKKTDSYGD